jgi:small subunit ribosomal protein S1
MATEQISHDGSTEPRDSSATQNGSANPESSAPSDASTSTATAASSPTATEGEPAHAAARGGDVPADDTTSSDDEGGDETEGGEGAEGESAEASTGAEGDKPKRKRKRRRKKKPGEATADGAVAGAAGAAPAPAEGSDRGADRGPRKSRPPKHRPPTERAPFHSGEEVFGKVTSVLDHAVMIDLSGKALAIFDRSEMEADDLIPAVGDRFVARVHQDGSRGGLVVLSRKPLREEESKPKVEQAAKDGTLVQGLVTGVIKGGVEVDIGGLRAFAPASGMDLHPQNANFVQLLGQVLGFKVIQYDAGGRDVVVTRRPMLEAEAHERRKKALELLTEGQVLKGIVRTIVEWGAFVALPEAENLEGLVHISEASHDPRARISELFHPGEETEVKITKIDDKGKIWLSRRALIKDPWAEAREKFSPGSRLTGKVVRVEKFGVFVDLGDGFEGLIHVSDLTLKKIEHPNELVKVDDPIDVVVAHFDARDRKVSLHPAPTGDQANEAPQKVQRNGVVKVEVVRGEAAGVIVRILGVSGRGARGFIPAGQTGTVRGTDLRKKFPAGMKLETKIIDVDPRRGEPKLSVTQAAQDEERRAHSEYRKQLAREGGFGTLGDLLAQKLKG